MTSTGVTITSVCRGLRIDRRVQLPALGIAKLLGEVYQSIVRQRIRVAIEAKSGYSAAGVASYHGGLGILYTASSAHLFTKARQP